MLRRRSMLLVLLTTLSLVPAASAYQVEDRSSLTLERIYAKHEFDAEGFSGRWLAGIDGYTRFASAKGSGRGNDLVLVNAETGATEILVPAAHFVPPGTNIPLNVEDYHFSNDHSKLLLFTNSKRIWRVNSRGDFWVLDRTSRELRKLGGKFPASALGHAKFSPDGLKVAYVAGNDLFVEDLRSHAITALTKASPDEINGSFDWVYEEELSLRDGFRWSPDSQSIAYWQLNTSGVREVALVNNTAGLYPKVTLIRYPKVGEVNSACRVGVVPAEGGPTRWVAVPGDPREHYIATLEWIDAEGGARLALQQLNRLQNQVIVYLSEPTAPLSRRSTGALTKAASVENDSLIDVKAVLTDRDPAWVDLQQKLFWVKKQTEFLWLTEANGWKQIERVKLADGSRTPVTAGKFDVMEIVAVDPSSELAYFNASPQNATQRYLYKARLDGSQPQGERVKFADQPGTHHHEISPDGKWAIHQYSNFDTPPTIDLVRLPTHDLVRRLVDNKTLKAKLAALTKTETSFVKVEGNQPGLSLDGWRILPANFDATKSYPLLIHVYGEPASQSVLDVWSGGNALWHRMLAQKGYVVMSFDNRGTPAAKGREWRKAVYRQVGILAPKDQAAAVTNVLKLYPYLDPARVGVWGWSGGGSMTLNAMFKYPDLYKTGIAIASVPNQRLYDTIYQERYMGLPGDNANGFENGSPINFAHQLKGKLLLIHGTGDDNCHYQGAEALIDELVRHDKRFTLMAYPNRSHAISEGANTTMHLRRLMTDFLLQNLPATKKERLNSSPRPHPFQ